MNKLINLLWILFHPSFWLQVGGEKVSESFDVELNKLLNDGQSFKVLNKYEAKFGPYTLWLCNYPYASFTTEISIGLPDGLTIPVKIRPKRRTIKKLGDAFCKQYPELGFLLFD